MSVIPTVSADGVGVVSAGQLNAYEISCYNVGVLRTVVGQTGMSVFLQGTNTPNDGGQGNFYWDYTSTATDNNFSVIRPYGVIYGAWLRTVVASSTTPGGISGSVQYNNGSGGFAGSSNLTFDGTTLSTNSLKAVGNPVIPFTFAGDPGLDTVLINSTAASTTNAEIGLVVGMNSSTSGSDSLNTYKMGLASYIQMNPGSAYGWASNFVATAASGVGNVSCIGCEIDLNIANRAYTGTTGPAYAANLYLTGTSTTGNYGNAGVMLAYGGSPTSTGALWNYGILSVDYTTAYAYNTAFISDQSKSPIIFQANNSHTTGIDFSAATFSGNSLALPGFYISGAGKVSIGTTGTTYLLQSYTSSNSLQIESVVRNDQSGSGVAAIGFNVSSTAASETTSTKAGIGFTRQTTYGVGSLAFYLNTTTSAGDFTTADEKMRLDYSSSGLLIGYTASNGAYKLQVNSQIFATSSTIATSDARYKQNVTTLTGALTVVQALRPVSFDWKKHPIHNFDTDNTTVGFLAQEVQQALTDKPYLNSIIKKNICVIEPAVKDDNGNITKTAVTEEFLGIAEGNMIALLTAAIQELKAEFDQYKLSHP